MVNDSDTHFGDAAAFVRLDQPATVRGMCYRESVARVVKRAIAYRERAPTAVLRVAETKRVLS